MHNAINNTRRLIPEHYATLLGERPAGSQWGRDFTAQDFDLPWRPALPHVAQPKCRYYVLDNDAMARAFPSATLGAVPYCDLTAAQRATVFVTVGPHGPELRMVGAHQRASEAWLIVGPHQNHDVIYTAHPGAPLLPLSQHPLDPTLPIAVKLV